MGRLEADLSRAARQIQTATLLLRSFHWNREKVSRVSLELFWLISSNSVVL